MNGYENGKIYKVVDKNDNIIYIGSTKTSLNKRWSHHHLNCDENKIVLIENYPCDSLEKLRKAEQKIIDLYNEMGLVNQRKAYCSKEERKQNIKEYKKTDKFKETLKKYKKTDKFKEYQKIYNQTDKCKETKKKYEQSDKRKEYLKIKVNCHHCDKLLLKNNLVRHTKLHCKNKPIDNI